jgi:hypothetical protein
MLDPAGAIKRTVGDDRPWWFLALAAIAHRGYADARDRLASS